MRGIRDYRNSVEAAGESSNSYGSVAIVTSTDQMRTRTSAWTAVQISLFIRRITKNK
jgi:hypothetical protein